MIKLGKMVEDELTKFRGIATARLEPMHGMNKIYVQPTVRDDSVMPQGEWIYESQLKAKKQEAKK